MSTSNNMDERLVLHYIKTCLNNWGLTYLTQQHLKQAKKNQGCNNIMANMLFDLVILHIFDYQYCIDEINIVFNDENQRDQVVLAHLYEIDCPMLVVFDNQNQEENVIGFDFGSSRHVLITCGWLMAVSDFFGQTMPKLVKKKMYKIYQAKPLDLTQEKHHSSHGRINMHSQSPIIERIAFLSKTFKSRSYSLDCLKAKKNKLIRRIKENLSSISHQLTIEDLFSRSNQEEIRKYEDELGQMLSFEKKNMSYRKYWWAWLDNKIITNQQKVIKEEFQNYQKLQRKPEDIHFRIQIDLNYIRTYVETCKHYQERIENIQNNIEQMGLKMKKSSKDIDRQITEDIKRISQKGKIQQNNFPSFIGMQLKKEMNIDSAQEQIDPSQHKQLVKISTKNLKDSIRGFIDSLEGIILF